jgi:RNA polymerase sigma-70 factor, ECF subfamily
MGDRAVRQKDRDDFEALYRAHVRSVLAYALTHTSREDAQDVVANTFLVAWRRLDAVPADPLPWLIGVARRVLADLRRAEVRRTSLNRRLAVNAASHPPLHDDVGVAMALRGAIGDALVQLRPQDREIVTLAAWQGFTTEQLATVLGCSKALASLRLHRARGRFARFFEEQRQEQLPAGGASVRAAREIP